MVVITLSIVVLATMLAALGHIARGTRKLDAHLQSLLHTQREHRGEMETDVERLRQYYNRT